MAIVKHPQVQVEMTGEDGNAFAILGRCKKALRKARIDDDGNIWEAFHTEATSGDYDHLLQTVLSWFTVDGAEPDDDTENNNCEQCGATIDKWHTFCDDCEDDE